MVDRKHLNIYSLLGPLRRSRLLRWSIACGNLVMNRSPHFHVRSWLTALCAALHGRAESAITEWRNAYSSFEVSSPLTAIHNLLYPVAARCRHTSSSESDYVRTRARCMSALYWAPFTVYPTWCIRRVGKQFSNYDRWQRDDDDDEYTKSPEPRRSGLGIGRKPTVSAGINDCCRCLVIRRGRRGPRNRLVVTRVIVGRHGRAYRGRRNLVAVQGSVGSGRWRQRRFTCTVLLSKLTQIYEE